jgi:nucleotide-binding universal stress UspA family protein
MFKRILVAVDGSDASRRGLREAAALAADQGATLFVLYVVEGMPAGWSNYVGQQFRPARIDLLLQGLRASGQRLLDEACEAVRSGGLSPEAVMVDARGRSFAEATLDEAHRIGADLVVLGTHGRDGMARLIKGSDAESLLRRANVPMLVVREPSATRDREAPADRAARPDRPCARRPDIRTHDARFPPPA